MEEEIERLEKLIELKNLEIEEQELEISKLKDKLEEIADIVYTLSRKF